MTANLVPWSEDRGPTPFAPLPVWTSGSVAYTPTGNPKYVALDECLVGYQNAANVASPCERQSLDGGL